MDTFWQDAPRIFHLILGQDHGGVENFYVKFATALEQRGVPQRSAILKGRIWAEQVRAAGSEVVELPFGGLSEPLARWRLSREIRDFRPDVVLAWMDRAAKRVRRGDYVTAVRLPGFIGTGHIRRCEHAIVTAPHVRDYIASLGFPPANIHICSNFGTMPDADPMPRAAFDTPENVPLVVALGRLIEKKGFDVLLDAIAQVPRAHLWLAGDGELEAALKAQAERLGLADRVRFLGWVDRQAALFAAADIVAVPSRSEPFGNVVVEAWVSGTPIVATNLEGPGWLITHEKDGLLVSVENPGSLARAINRLIDEPHLAASLAEQGRRTHDERFSEENVCRRYVLLFRDLIAQRRGETAA